MILEVCIENATRINELIKKNIKRVELCDNLAVGGTTVSYGVAKNVLERCHSGGISVMAMVRPRGGDFVYDRNEIEIMISDILILKELNVNGVVFGCLTSEGEIDKENILKLVRASNGIERVFHMAFDHIKPEKQIEAIEWLTKNGFTRILTHGSNMGNNIMENISRLKEYVAKSESLGITIMIGGGVNKHNYAEIVKILGITEVHGTKIV